MTRPPAEKTVAQPEGPGPLEIDEAAAQRAQAPLPADAAPDRASFVLGADGRVVTWNMGAARLHGYFAEEIVGEHVSRLYADGEVGGGTPEEELTRATAEGRCEAEGWRVRWDGSRFWANVVTVALRDRTGTLEGFSQTTRDITERKHAEDSARALVEVGRILAESMDATAVAERIAEEIRGLLGSQNAALYRIEPGSSNLAALAVSGEARSPLSRLVLGQGLGAPSLAVRERRPIVIRDLLTDSRIALTLEARLSVVHAPDRAMLAVPLLAQDRVVGALGVLDRAGRVFDEREIRLAQAFADQAALGLETSRLYRESVRAYEELLRAQEQLARAQKMEAVGRLAGGVAHDFNNLLTVIIASSQMLLGRLSLADPARRDIELIDRAARGAAKLTGQLLDFSRQRTLQAEVFDLNITVESIGPMLRRLMGERIEVVTQLEAASAPVKADPGKVEQVLVNLALNARDAMPRGGRLTIETANVERGQTDGHRALETGAGPYVMLAVRDSGIGMDEHVLARVFEPFFTTKASGKGTGLGLSVAYGIVKQSGGDIAVESAPGRGTTFRVWLPRVVERTAARLRSNVGAAQAPRGDETILLVEDDETLRSALSAGLQASGYAVLEARDGREALALCEGYTEPIHLLLADVVLPLFSGRELADLLLGTRPDLKVLYMSGYAEDSAIPTGQPPSDRPFLEKPFTLGTLLTKMRGVLDAGEAS